MSGMKKSTVDNAGCKTSSKNVFSQLRHLAGQLETGIPNIQQELDRPKETTIIGCTKHTSAINFLLHTKKDMTELKEEASKIRTKFVKENAKFDKIAELMKQFLVVQSERVENVESYLEKYGYPRPVFESEKPSTQVNEVQSNCGNDGSDENNDEDEEELEENDMNNSCEFNDDEDKKTKPSTPTLNNEKERNFQTMRTPKLEDMYKNLSEETISLFKHAGKGKSQNEAPAIKSNSFFQKGSVDSAQLPLVDNEKEVQEKYQLLQQGNYPGKYEMTSMESHKFDIHNYNPETYGSPDAPKLMTSGCDLTSTSKKTKDNKNFYQSIDLSASSSKDRLNSEPRTPEPPALLSGFFTFNSHTKKFETLGGHTMAAKTPDTAKLLTPGFKLNSFATRGSDSGAFNIETSAMMKSPEVPKLLMQGLTQSDFVTSPVIKDTRKSAKSLFNTPPKPELFSSYLTGNTLDTDCKENIKDSKISYMSTPEPPKLLSRDNNFSFSRKYPPTDNYRK